MAKRKPIDKMSFEEALAELEEIVKKIDTGQENLANAVSSFERGMMLKSHCESMLKDAKLKIEKITNSGQSVIDTTEISLE